MNEYNQALEDVYKVIEQSELQRRISPADAADIAAMINDLKRPEGSQVETYATITDEDIENKWGEFTAGPYNFDRVIEARRKLARWAYDRGALHPLEANIPFDGDNIFLLRQAVIDFAVDMEKRLRANDHKDGWDQMGLLPLYAKLGEEMGELGKILFYVHSDDGTSLFEDFQPDQIILEAADVANVAMMIKDQAERFERNLKQE